MSYIVFVASEALGPLAYPHQLTDDVLGWRWNATTGALESFTPTWAQPSPPPGNVRGAFTVRTVPTALAGIGFRSAQLTSVPDLLIGHFDGAVSYIQIWRIDANGNVVSKPAMPEPRRSDAGVTW